MSDRPRKALQVEASVTTKGYLVPSVQFQADDLDEVVADVKQLLSKSTDNIEQEWTSLTIQISRERP